MREAHHPNFYPDAIEGLSSARVRVIGRLHRSVEAAAEDGSEHFVAPVEMIWAITMVHEFQVESITVGAWALFRTE